MGESLGKELKSGLFHICVSQGGSNSAELETGLKAGQAKPCALEVKVRCILGFYLLLNLKAVGGVGDSGTLTVAIAEEHAGTGVQQLAEAIISRLKSSA